MHGCTASPSKGVSWRVARGSWRACACRPQPWMTLNQNLQHGGGPVPSSCFSLALVGLRWRSGTPNLPSPAAAPSSQSQSLALALALALAPAHHPSGSPSWSVCASSPIDFAERGHRLLGTIVLRPMSPPPPLRYKAERGRHLPLKPTTMAACEIKSAHSHPALVRRPPVLGVTEQRGDGEPQRSRFANHDRRGQWIRPRSCSDCSDCSAASQ